MILMDALMRRLAALGYKQDSINRIVAQHWSRGSLDELITEIERMEDEKNGV